MEPQSQFKLEYKLLYSLVVAGKSANFAENVMKKFLHIRHVDELNGSPFAYIRWIAQRKRLTENLVACRSGNYVKLAHAFQAIVASNLDLRTCTPADLETIKGIGPKTSRFFILWTRPNEQYAALDTHILKWLRYLGHKAPMSTPSGKKYAELEQVFLTEVKRRAMTTSALDFEIWEHCRDNAKAGIDYNQDSFWTPRLRKLAA